MKVLFLVMVAFALSGCATKQYFHTSIADQEEAKRQRVIDDAYCTQVAMGSIDMPQVRHQPSGSYRSSGTISGYNQDGGYSTYTYSGSTRPSAADSFSSGFANGMNIGSAIAAGQARNKLHHACMLAKGWSEDEAKAVKSSARNQAADDADKKWRDTIAQFLDTEASRPNGIDYRNNSFKMLQLDAIVKELANDPKNEGKPMLWYLVEADRIVKEHYSPERSLSGR
jgi:outer membrane lipoprotein SlyB